MEEVISNIEKMYPWMIALSFSFVVFSQIIKNNVENTVGVILTQISSEKALNKDDFKILVREVGFREQSILIRTILFLSFLIQFIILIFTKISEFTPLFGNYSVLFKVGFFTNALMLFALSLLSLIFTFKNPRQTLYKRNWT